MGFRSNHRAVIAAATDGDVSRLATRIPRLDWVLLLHWFGRVGRNVGSLPDPAPLWPERSPNPPVA